MFAFTSNSIRRKLLLVVMLTTGVALALASVLFVAYDHRDHRDLLERELTVLARVLGRNASSSLAFLDDDAATNSLQALEATPGVIAAAVYDQEGVPFARYQRADAPPGVLPAEPFPGQTRSLPDYLLACEPIRVGERTIGAICVAHDFTELRVRTRRNAVIVGAIFLGSGCAGLLLTIRLQRRIASPIVGLSNTIRAVAERDDYSLRATKETTDEIGYLIDRFNEMLARVERHDRDLTRLNSELQSSEQRALAANRAKSQFLANISHELRTPLNAIIGYSEMLQEEAADLGQGAFVPDLQKIQSAGRHLLALINDILDLSKIEAGKMTVYLEDFDPATLVREVAATVQPLIQRGDNRLELDCPASLGSMRSDQTKVRQILFNLVSNAAKFTEKGVIRLRVTADEPPPAAERESGPGPSADPRPVLTFRVADTGIGMTPEQLGKLFQAFTQADAATTRKYGGTGLGLAISRRFCHMLGGELTVESEAGRGSTFTATLPRVSQQTPADSNGEAAAGAGETADRSGPAVPAPEAASAGSAATVLVIDDDDAAREILRRSLTREGFHVEVAADGRTGIALARRLRPAAITLDVMMPEMDGWSVLSALKNDPELAEIPVVMLTILEERQQGFALGAADYLTKPVDHARLAAVLRQHRQSAAARTVLVVEDDAAARDVLQRTLSGEGWLVATAADGREALRFVARDRPGLIVLDLMLPGIDGFDFLRELSALPGGDDIPVIVVTARDLSPDDLARLHRRVGAVVQKGAYRLADLLPRIHRLVAPRHATGAAKETAFSPEI